MKEIIIAVLLAIAPALTGCVIPAKTTVHYEKRPDGTLIADYTSDKEQIGLEAALGDARIKVDKSGTQESVIAAQLQLQLKMFEIMQELTPLIKAAATKGAVP